MSLKFNKNYRPFVKNSQDLHNFYALYNLAWSSWYKTQNRQRNGVLFCSCCVFPVTCLWRYFYWFSYFFPDIFYFLSSSHSAASAWGI